MEAGIIFMPRSCEGLYLPEPKFPMMIRRAFFFLPILCLFNLSFAQIDTKIVRAELNEMKASSGLRNGQLGFALYDVESGKLLEKERLNETMLPASTLKTVTSAAALGILGEDFKFKTKLEYDGKIEDGVLRGNIYIKGGGDPTLGSSRFKWGTDMPSILAAFVKKIKAKGIRSIEGSIIGDASIFEDALLPVTWVWSDIGNYYGAGANGLTFNENTYYIYFQPGKTAGEPAEFLRTEPAMPDIQFINEMKTGRSSSGDNGYVYGGPYTFLRFLRGTVPAGGEFSIKGSIPDPALFTAQSLQAALAADSIKVKGISTSIRKLKLEGKANKDARTTLYTHQSPPLKDIVYWLNKKSVNLYAEHMLKMIGYVKLKDGSNSAGVRAIEAYWAGKGIDIGGMHLNDGSGLSRYNGITPGQLAGMLRVNAGEPWFESFWNSLPIAGDLNDPGTLRRMCKGTPAAGNVRAKSGYISRVRTYAGYVNTKSGKRLSFAMMANNYTCTNAQIKKMLADLMVAMANVE